MADRVWSFRATDLFLSMKHDPAIVVEQTDRIFSALAHPSRRHILLTLSFREGQMSAGEIANRFGCSWPTTTRHLNILRESGLISVEKLGRERVYTLDQKKLTETVGGWLNWFTKAQKDK